MPDFGLFFKNAAIEKPSNEIHRSQGLSVMPGISSYDQQLRAVGKSGGGWWGPGVYGEEVPYCLRQG